MIVGDKSLFAIEWQTRCIIEDKRHFHFRFWSSGLPIGDFEDDVMDSLVIGNFEYFLQNEKHRKNYDSLNKDANHIFEVVYKSIFDPIDNKYMEELNLLKKEVPCISSTFHLTDIGGTGFDDVDILACNEGESGQRLIWKIHSTSQIFETKLPKNYIETVAKKFIKTASLGKNSQTSE